MKCLITGAAGFVGYNMTKSLLEDGYRVIGVDSLSRKGAELNLKALKEQFPGFEFKQREIEDTSSLVYHERPDLIYHFAAQVAVTSSVENPRRDFKVNAQGTFDVACAARDVGIPVIYTSTNKVFGDNVNKVELQELETRYDFKGELERKGIGEDFSIDAPHHTPYGCSKLTGEIYVRDFGGVANRCSCMYGPNQYGIVDQGWISHIAQRAIKEETITIFGNGKQVRDILQARDIVSLLRKQGEAITSGSPDIRGEVFNVGGGYENTISLLELCKRWGVPKERIKFEDWRPADQKVFYCDISKAKKILNWEPKVGLDQGLSELYKWTEESIYT